MSDINKLGLILVILGAGLVFGDKSALNVLTGTVLSVVGLILFML